MEWGTVSAASMAGMVFSFVVSVGTPLALAVMIRRKCRAQMTSLFVGAAAFIFFAMILEQLLHALVLQAAGAVITSHLLLYALYGGVAAALFEETGRYLAMRRYMKNNLNRENALMYGAGHGGAEAIMLMGMTSVNNLITSAMINSGALPAVMSQMDAETAQTTFNQLAALWQTPAWLFFMGGVERVSALALQVGLSLLMFRAVKDGRRNCLVLAFAIHFLVDFMSVIAAGTLPVTVVELALLAASAALLWYVFRYCWKENQP